MPITPITNIPTTVEPVSNRLVDVKIIYPIPELDPIISPEIVHIKAIPIATLSPDTIYGKLDGTITSVNICELDAPNDCAASIKTGSVLCTPSIVEISIGKTHPMKIMNTAGPTPIPNHIIEKGIHAIGGIGLKILITNLHNLSNSLNQPNIMPNVIPTTDASNIPNNTLYSVSKISLKSWPETTNLTNEFATSVSPGNM